MVSDAHVSLLSDPQAEDGAQGTFHAVLQGIREARESIEIFMYVWRNDAIGNEVGRAVLDAAERGVKVKIIKFAVKNFLRYFNAASSAIEKESPRRSISMICS